METVSIPPPRSLRSRIFEWLVDIVIVFVGVYAAFLLNAWQTHRQDRATHLQILQSLAQDVSETVQGLKSELVRNQTIVDQFQQQVAAGEMPPLHLMSFSTSYDAADDLALSQAGADRLLDFKTVKALKNVSALQRQGFGDLRKYQQLDYELIAPHLDDPKESFYNPETKKLRPMYAWYISALKDLADFMHDDLAANEKLLTQVNAELAALQ